MERSPAPPPPSLEQKIAFLSSPTAYRERPPRVAVKETHLSWLFLTRHRVYKLKKPVRRPRLDFRSLAGRERNARAELRLNRRLAEEAYLDVVALTLERDGRLSLGGEGRVVDWLVEMRRLPEGRMLDTLVRRGKIQRPDIEALAERLLAFYSSLPPAKVSAEEYRAGFAREQRMSVTMLAQRRHGLRGAILSPALARVDEVLLRHPELLEERTRQRRIVEGHGDLRPEHICCLDPPAIIDCLEFSRALRLVDPFDELAFLGLECTLLDAGWIGELLFQRLAPELGGTPPAPLLQFYWAYRACLRARQALAHLHAPKPRHPTRWRPLARRYLELAADGVPWLRPLKRLQSEGRNAGSHRRPAARR